MTDMIRDNSAQFASRPHQKSLSTLPVHPLPGPFVPVPSHTPYNGFPTQCVMPMHPSLFQNQPSQPYAYHGYRPPEFSPYPPSRYFPLHQHQSQPYFLHRSTSAQGGGPSYQQAGHFPPPMPQFAASGYPAPSHTGLYRGIQQYSPHHYTATGHPEALQQYRFGVYQWYHDPAGSSADMQVQEHYPMTYPPQTHRPRRDSNTLRAHPTGSERLPSPCPSPNNNSISVTGSRHTMSPAVVNSQEHISVKSSPKLDTHELNQKSVASTSRAQDRPIRRPYHPNPPRNRSEWVMWVGNIPSDATHEELWRFLKQTTPVPLDSEGSGGGEDSGSEAHLSRAVSQFNGRKLRPRDRRCPRLVCRARRREDDLRAGVGAQRGMGVHTHYVRNTLRKGNESSVAGEESGFSKGPRPPSAFKNEETPTSDTVEGGTLKVPTRSPGSCASTSSSLLSLHFPKRFFILKSLSRYDLDLSTERYAWATQKHNEAILDQAYRTSSEVTLIFSVNKSGEFYGYARMTSGISRGNRNISWAPRADSLSSMSSPSRHAQTYPSLSEREFGEVSPIRMAPSSGESEDGSSVASSSSVESTQERQSAPSALDRDSVGPNQTLWSCFSPSRQGWSQVSQIPEPHPRPLSGSDPHSTRQPLGLRLLPVMEDVRTESGAEEGQPEHMAALPAAMHAGHSEGGEREASWGETFKIEWLSTDRVPFHRTRHLRNPWNYDREIKVSRDGTELEPSVGQQLVDSWSSLASEPLSGDDARRTAGSRGRRGGRSNPKPGPSPESRGLQEESS